MKFVHCPVLAQEVVEFLKPAVDEPLVVDGTVGEGGHSDLFLESWPGARVVGIDADAVMGERAGVRLERWGRRFSFIQGWCDEILGNWEEGRLDVVFLDLGVSLFHYAGRGRGFSFQSDERPDMRLWCGEGDGGSDEACGGDGGGGAADEACGAGEGGGDVVGGGGDVVGGVSVGLGSRGGRGGKGYRRRGDKGDAFDLIHTMNEWDLADLIFKYGEERFSRSIARRIVREREKQSIDSSRLLAEIVSSSLPPKERRKRIHAATRTFQALRIAVNGELDHLERFLEIAPNLLAPGGKLGIISFHSLEDRMVKRRFRELARDEGTMFGLGSVKPIVAGDEEKRENPPSRSAKFRVLIRHSLDWDGV